MKRILAFITLGILLAGCGQKGPLYLPPADSAGFQQTIEAKSPDEGGVSS
ncbi:lipoprotein [Parendozoicomonas haliclonae]|uniref:Lipopeptide n=1 Tax=Parendozoicomonas haliclonae TaxID=1960125 RepID=A0A1X7ALK0_9GAMM|nr:lipoprotein [Parendozoicomonas haliclonae]SMA48461.1 hypothetical protein EHSB41UT_02750 [Parendozoicomonas haliclonae]